VNYHNNPTKQKTLKKLHNCTKGKTSL